MAAVPGLDEAQQEVLDEVRAGARALAASLDRAEQSGSAGSSVSVPWFPSPRGSAC